MNTRDPIPLTSLKLNQKVHYIDKQSSFRLGRITKIYPSAVTITDCLKIKRKIPKTHIIGRHFSAGFYPILENMRRWKKLGYWEGLA